MNKKQEFYNLKAENKNIVQLGILGFFLHKMIRFYIDRKKVALNMLPENIVNALDVGSDRGQFLISLSRRIFKYAYGVDISPILVKEASKIIKEKKLDNKISFKLIDIDKGLPFTNNKFALVTCLAVLEHVFDPQFVFKEIARVARPGGLIIIQVPNVAWLPRRLTLLFGNRPRTSWAPGWDGGHLGYFTLTDIENLFKENNIEIKKVRCSGIMAWLKNFWPKLLGADFVVLGVKK